MSLNGLDTGPVVEAYQGALADAGGWLLLHYIARDEVTLFARGTGGVPEIRNAIEGHEECSPLYGFLQYRRRKVIIRYMPEGLSRLILARSNVQFHSVTDKFTPNDTVLPLSKASDLTESALSSACLLHTASTSITSSSSSLRRRRLMEITEDAEENGTKEEATKPAPPPPQPEARERSESIRSEATLVPPNEPPVEPPVELPPTSPESEQASIDFQPPPSRASSRAATSPVSPSESQPAATSPKSMDSSRSSSRSRYRNILDEFPRPSEEARMSTQSARPTIQELERAAGFTPKVKLGPRPSVDSSGRPRTSGSTRNQDQRPVASLPTNMRSSSVRRSNGDVPRPRSQGSTFATKPTSRVPPVPPLLVPPPSIPISRPQLSPGAKSLGALSSSSGLTPEKERLMKALQQRKKNMAKRAEETKKKQASEKEQSKPQTLVSKDEEENKENIIIQYAEPELEIPKPETVLQDQPEVPSIPLGSVAERVPEPLGEPAPEPAPEPILEAAPVAVVEPVTDPIVERASTPALESPSEPVSNTEQEQTAQSLETPQPEPTDDVSPASTEVPPSPPSSNPTFDTPSLVEGVNEPSETVQVEETQEAPEDETRTEHEEPAIPDLAPPTLNDDVPLANESSDAPQSDSDDIHGTHFEIPPVTPVSTDEPLNEPDSTEAVESVPQPATPSVTPPESTGTEIQAAPVSVPVCPSPSEESVPEYTSTPKGEALPLDQRRKVHLEPIQVPTPDYSDDDNLLSDDSFMEELTSATVQEARPVSVKSPNGGDQTWKSSRAVSSPYSMGSPSAAQTLAVGRSVSSPYSENGPPTPVLMAKKINVSSGISSRIKALEKFSSREGTPMSASPAPSAPSASSSFENLRKRASISLPSGSQDITPPGTIHSAHTPDSFNHHDRRISVDAMRRANSVSVTARIVRDADISPGSSGLEPSESDVLNLQASPLTVEHETPSPQTSNAELASRAQDRSMSMSSNGSGRQTTSRPGSRLSISSRPPTGETMNSTSPTSEDKRGSRASRLMRRVSSITSTSRRSIIGALSSPVKEEEYAPTFANGSTDAAGSTDSRTSEPVDIGEVNVQFPETLLWKRRVMRIDESGYVVLTPGTNDATARNMTKRYHLTEFRTPCLPDEDMQELPNSILLDFLDGNTLQCACESRQGQASALHALIEAHSAHKK
ncbi:hypothetical protein N7541_009853 [Penicillium brevicompactum]|uniref:GPI-anchored cell surface glycoprotein n=1 Tax=Penicillium brevicompactum TaxID=5074 RepID=A0A9W9UHM4_PENBR|nr:hypothetical protein N7541_009853 [Penicillium brevicompactum]